VAELFRVLPYFASAVPDEPGGPLYLPPQGGGRIDNPGTYSVLYLSDSPAGAVAEAFGRFPEWTAAILEGPPVLPGSRRALARYTLKSAEAICNLDDAKQLVALGLRPSDVVSRDYSVSRAWARRVFDQKTGEQKKWIGVCWWSYYSPKWSSYGLWDLRGLAFEDVMPLRLDHPAMVEASNTIVRRISR
jgi:hypothetical protein